MKHRFVILLLIIISKDVMSQGLYNHVWLLGSYNFIQNLKGRIYFDSTSYVDLVENRKMPFYGTEATICDKQGDFLMSTNGIWIANASNDTMLNGGGLNPNGVTSSWQFGLPFSSNAVFIPYPGDTNRYILFHHTYTYDGFSYPPYELYSSEVDMNLDFNLGGVTLKNQIILQDTLNGGIGAVKHANGRDWWILMTKHGTNTIYKILVTPNGNTITSQTMNNAHYSWYNGSQFPFNNIGNRFAYSVYDSLTNDSYIVTANFDRCTGLISNDTTIQLTYGNYLWGTAFSPSGKKLYACSSSRVFQIDTDSLTIDTVATYDGFISPPGQTCCATSFWNMYLAANGKIYITSGSGVQHLHEMNYPDSAGVACDVQQHAISLGYAQLRAVPNHPNYNLGPVVGSVCDTLSVGLSEPAYDFRFSISPNPVSDGVVKLTYLLPQNKAGLLEVYDLTGQRVYSQQLPPWSTLQFVQLPELSSGLYTCVIRSGNEKTAKKLVVMR
ncbi:MAG: T9SS type A sorting domain-containing protein [Bacteroidia bacterium]|nr:T9SS type A sorting domain-containing protein [Bacteroidia bacterium]